ncbi:MAG: hypothetical protein JWM11_555 [Planctomycetaceae bacterium]|nr:hypothetical protein [Planctomycetaceae bacterium]
MHTNVALAHRLGMNVTNELVERPSQLPLLREIGFESGRGYLYSQPALSESFDNRVNENDYVTLDEYHQQLLLESTSLS